MMALFVHHCLLFMQSGSHIGIFCYLKTCHINTIFFKGLDYRVKTFQAQDSTDKHFGSDKDFAIH